MPTVKLDWTDNNGDETGHEIYRSLSSIDPVSPGSPLATIAANLTTYNDTTANDGVSYFYRVAATRSTEKAFSSQIQVNVPSSVQLWTPAQITTALWLDADDSSTIQLNGSNVVQWSDKSGNNRHGTESTAANQPAFIASGINSKPSLDWGNDSNTKRIGWDSGGTNTEWREVFIVGQFTSETFPSYNGLFGGFNQNGTSFGIGILGDTPSPNNWFNSITIFQDGFFMNGSTSHSLLALPTIRQPFVFRLRASSANSITGYRVGADRDVAGRGWLGKISEVVGFSSLLTSDNTLKMEGYLAHKWGTVANLPVDHPYKINPPTI